MTLWRFVASFFYLGNLPIAPGTWGSLGALLFWVIIPKTYIIQISLIIILFIIGMFASEKIAKYMNDSDPSEVVIDEVVGMSISLFMLPHSLGLYALAFILFRIFDIFKPSFIYQIQNLPGAWGIMLDDVMSGILTLIMVNAIATIL